jgi:hypothetical protein
MPFIEIALQKNPHGPQLESPTTQELRSGTPDAILVQAYPNRHIRRTLDQYFYTGMEDTTVRDQDQVIYRVQRHLGKEEPKIIVVGQLWLWILNEGLAPSERQKSFGADRNTGCIVTSFPQNGDDSTSVGADVSTSILVDVTVLQNIGTVNDLAALIASHCIDIFNYEQVSGTIGTSKIVDMYAEFLQILVSLADWYSETSANVAQSSEGKQLYSKALDSTNHLNRIRDESRQEEAISALTSRDAENKILMKLRDTRDELEIISLLQGDQLRVIRDLRTIIGKKEDQNFQIRYKRLQDEIDDQVADVANLLKLAARISVDVSPARSSTSPAAANNDRSIKSWSLNRTQLL